MTTAALIIRLFGLLLCYGYSESRASETPLIEVSVAPEACSERKVTLRVTAVNAGPKPMTLYNWALPWGSQAATLLVAVTQGSQPRILKRSGFMIHHSPETTVLAPAVPASGSIDLDFNYPGFADELKKSDVIIFWSYAAETSEEVRSSRYSGSIGLKHLSSNGSSECRTF